MPSLFRKMETRRLHGSDMKNIVRILRNDSHSSIDPGGSLYEKVTEAAIKKLPRRLRSSPLSSHGLLCRTHKGLDAHLIDDIWAWIKFELEVAIGRFLYPIIMSEILEVSNELEVRQLEPVVEMFNPHWTLAGSPPPGVQPIDTGDRWAYQKNGCPACMLARIGSDEGALFALFAGMYGHLRSYSGGQKGVGKIKSKRLRFVRYWMRTHTNGEQATFAAYELGMKLKALRRETKTSLRESGQPTRYTGYSLDDTPVTPRHCLDDQPAATLNVSDFYNPKDWSTKALTTSRTTVALHDPKIGPTSPLDPTLPTVFEGWNNKPLPKTPRASNHTQPLPPHSTKSTHSIHSTHKTEEDTVPPLPILSRTNLKRRDSVLSSSGTIHPPHPASSINSCPSRLTLATSIASFNNPSTSMSSRGYRYDPFDTPEERLDKYRKMLARTPFERNANKGEGTVGRGVVGEGIVEFQGRLLPKPSRVSMYSAFGEEGWDEKEKEFDEVDLSPPPSPGLEGVGEEEVVDEEDDENVDVDSDAFRTPTYL